MPEDLQSKEDNRPVVEGEATTAVLEAEPEIPNAELESFAREHEATGEKMVQAKVRAADERLDQMQRAGAIQKESDDTKGARDKHNQRVQASLELYKNEVKELRGKKAGAKETPRETPQEASDSGPRVLAAEAPKEEKAEVKEEAPKVIAEEFPPDKRFPSGKTGAYIDRTGVIHRPGRKKPEEEKEEAPKVMSSAETADEYLKRFGGSDQETASKKEEAPKPEPAMEQVFNGTEYPFQAVNRPVQEGVASPEPSADIKPEDAEAEPSRGTTAEGEKAEAETPENEVRTPDEKESLKSQIEGLRRFDKNLSKLNPFRLIVKVELYRREKKFSKLEKGESNEKENVKQEIPQAVSLFDKLRLMQGKDLTAKADHERKRANEDASRYGKEADDLAEKLSKQNVSFMRDRAAGTVSDRAIRLEAKRQEKMKSTIEELRVKEGVAKVSSEKIGAKIEKLEKARKEIAEKAREKVETEMKEIEKVFDVVKEQERIVKHEKDKLGIRQEELRTLVIVVKKDLKKDSYDHDYQRESDQDAHKDAMKELGKSFSKIEKMTNEVRRLSERRDKLKDQYLGLRKEFTSMGFGVPPKPESSKETKPTS